METNYEINILNFDFIEYKENNKKMIISCNCNLRDTYLEVFLSLIKHWEAPYELERISYDEKMKILTRLYNYLKKRFGKTYTIYLDIEYKWDFHITNLNTVELMRDGRHMLINIDLTNDVINLDTSLITRWLPPYHKEKINFQEKLNLVEIVYYELKLLFKDKKEINMKMEK